MQRYVIRIILSSCIFKYFMLLTYHTIHSVGEQEVLYCVVENSVITEITSIVSFTSESFFLIITVNT